MALNRQTDLSITIANVQNDWRCLDDDSFPKIEEIRLISDGVFTPFPDLQVDYIAPGRFADLFRKISIIYFLIHSIRLFIFSDAKSVVIVDGSKTKLWFWCGMLNAFPIFGKRKLLCWDVFVENFNWTDKRFWFFPFVKITKSKKDKVLGFILRQYGLNVLWSSKQVQSHAMYFDIPEHHFIFLPWKANHSKTETFAIPMNNFIFAGGNGKRDYKCLIDAVKGTGIPVIISATDPEVRKNLEFLPNVMLLGAPEPSFGQLQAASRMVVIPMIYSGLKGGGETNLCNAMWHRKAVIGVDSMAAEDYIVDGVTGFLIQSGDSQTLKEKILTLWNDPILCDKMGQAGRKHVEDNFTHIKSIRRLLRLALLYGYEKSC